MVYPHVQYVGAAYPDLLQPTPSTMARELDSRVSDGILVRLLWYPEDDHLSVAVKDTKTGETFELPIHPDERAPDVFRHPYAYAAGRNHRTGKPSATSADTAIAA
jgi:hypothetical protein